MESNDIVTRLRAVLHNDRSVELMNREAADEIERLREQLRLANIDNFNTTSEVETLRAEVEELTDEKFRHGGAFQQFMEESDGR